MPFRHQSFMTVAVVFTTGVLTLYGIGVWDMHNPLSSKYEMARLAY